MGNCCLCSVDPESIPSSVDGEYLMAKVYEVYDGDTVKVIYREGGCCGKWTKKSVRIYGCDAPELKGANVSDVEKKAAKIVRDWVRGQIEGKIVKLRLYDGDKYGRILAQIYYKPSMSPCDPSLDLSKELIRMKFVHEYSGGTKIRFTTDELETICK